MDLEKKAAPRGRPRLITQERIADAGIEMGLPNITFVGVASALGVTHMALYKHVPSLAELKHMVAEEIFRRWEFSLPKVGVQEGLQDYLVRFSDSVREFAKTYPGVTPYVIRRLVATPAMLEKIDAHQQEVAQAYRIDKDQSRQLLATIAFHGLAAADSVYSAARQETVVQTSFEAETAEMEGDLAQGMHALIAGALLQLQLDPALKP